MNSDPPVPGAEQFEWSLGREAHGRPFGDLDPWVQRILSRAWLVSRWTPSDQRAVVATLHRLPVRARAAVCQAMDAAFNPDPPPEHRASYVTVADLEPGRFLATFERVRAALALAPAMPEATRGSPQRAPASDTAWPEPRAADQRLRQAAVAYFGRSRPFTLEELAEYFGASVATIQRWRRDQALKVFVRGGVVRVSVEAAYELVTSNTV